LGSVRIIAGQWRSRRLVVAERPGLRPTSDRARETLFNWLTSWLPWGWNEVDVLDAYAGSGALGLEAASRGAASVTLIESDSAAARQINQNIASLNAAVSVRLVQGRFLDQQRLLAGSPFSLVFLDPPFGMDLVQPSLQATWALTRPQALVYLESERAWPGDLSMEDQSLWQIVRTGKTGRSFQTLLQKN